jgi:hypothetical protein
LHECGRKETRAVARELALKCVVFAKEENGVVKEIVAVLIGRF